VGVNKPETPTLDRRSGVIEESNSIGRFLDWLSGQGIRLARYEKVEGLRDEWLMPIYEGPSALLHRYFDIDPNAEETELRALLDYQRSLNP